MSASLTIRRMSLDFHAAACTVDAVARSGTAAVRAGLADRLGAALSVPEDDGVVLLRRLDIDLTLPAGAADGTLPALLAEAIAAAIRKGVADGRAVVRFASPTAHVAAFLVALVEGSAWGRWWFHRFVGLRSLPISAAIHTALLRDPTTALAVLAALPDALRGRVLAALGPAGAAHVVRTVRLGEPDAVPDGVWTRLAEALDGDGIVDPALRALALAATVAETPGALRAAARLLRLKAWVRAMPEQAGPWLANGAIPARLDGAAATLLAATPAAARQALAAREAAPPAPRPAATLLACPFGGYVLLCPGLLDQPNEAAIDGWPELCGAAPASLVRLLALAAAAGPARAKSLWQDAALRDLFGVAGPTATELDDWARGIGPARWAALARSLPVAAMREVGLPARLLRGRIARATLARLAAATLAGFARRLPGFAAASPAFLRSNLLGRGATFQRLPGSVHVRLERPPLDVLLAMTGLGDRRCRLPDGRVLILSRAP
ncbi:hypothetical protein [Falsiroseomonas sp. E2-1-a4]|uniref:hypothetical protein n=1 Tax=Falsiroseomonas sp. E2-1-a4 TaxID=3239299 RepID=UPI003F36296D